MSLKAIVGNIADVEEKHRDLYVQKGDKWELQVDGIKTQADIDRVTGALTKERADHQKTRDALKTANDGVAAFDGMAADEVKEKLEKLANLEAANTPELTKNFEKIVTDRVEAQLGARTKTATDKLNKDLAKFVEQNAVLLKERDGFQGQIRQRTVSDAIRAAADTAKVANYALPDAMAHASALFSVAEDGKVVTADGVTPEEWIEKRKELSPHWWPVARGAGGHGGDFTTGGDPAANPFTKQGWNTTEQSKMVLADPAKATRLASQAGVKIGDIRPAT